MERVYYSWFRFFFGIRPYSHNIISITLAIIAKHWSYGEANKAVKKLKLIELGWQEEKVVDK
jgi:hypothetical protein